LRLLQEFHRAVGVQIRGGAGLVRRLLLDLAQQSRLIDREKPKRTAVGSELLF
jgi:hypothetical protein